MMISDCATFRAAAAALRHQNLPQKTIRKVLPYSHAISGHSGTLIGRRRRFCSKNPAISLAVRNVFGIVRPGRKRRVWFLWRPAAGHFGRVEGGTHERTRSEIRGCV